MDGRGASVGKRVIECFELCFEYAEPPLYFVSHLECFVFILRTDPFKSLPIARTPIN
jgi:hypothetical protein